MFKRFSIVLAIIAGLVTPVQAAGTIAFSLSQQLDSLGKPLSGCKLFTIQAGTTSTPQNAFQDSGLTLPLPNPMTCDAAGRLPQFFLADGSIKVRLTNSAGVTQVVADGILVIGPSAGGGGGSPVDATTILATGDVKARYATGALTGFVRLNGRTIGSATSGATERANSDTQALFEYLCGEDINLVMTPARSGNCATDFSSNKNLALPDFRSRALAGLGDMGNSDIGLFSGVTFTSGNATTLGSLLGAARRTIAQANLPAVSPTFTGTAGTVNVTSTGSNINSGFTPVPSGSGGIVNVPSTQGSVNSTGSFTPSGTISALGSGTAFDAVSPFGLVTMYVKL